MKKFLILIFLGMTPLAFAQFDLLNAIDIGKAASGATKMAKGAGGIGIQEEMAIGGAVAVEIVAHYNGLWKDAAATQRVNLIGKTLGIFSDRPDLNYRFAILDSKEVNAFSAPGGYIFITRGAYDAATNDQLLAGVLAHEIAHVAHRHALQMIARNEFFSGLTEVASGASSDFGIFDEGVGKITNTLFKHGFDSDTEFEADHLAFTTTKIAGYDPRGLYAFLKKLESSQKSQTFSAHPDIEDRLERLASLAKSKD